MCSVYFRQSQIIAPVQRWCLSSHLKWLFPGTLSGCPWALVVFVWSRGTVFGLFGQGSLIKGNYFGLASTLDMSGLLQRSWGNVAALSVYRSYFRGPCVILCLEMTWGPALELLHIRECLHRPRVNRNFWPPQKNKKNVFFTWRWNSYSNCSYYLHLSSRFPWQQPHALTAKALPKDRCEDFCIAGNELCWGNHRDSFTSNESWSSRKLASQEKVWALQLTMECLGE